MLRHASVFETWIHFMLRKMVHPWSSGDIKVVLNCLLFPTTSSVARPPPPPPSPLRFAFSLCFGKSFFRWFWNFSWFNLVYIWFWSRWFWRFSWFIWVWVRWFYRFSWFICRFICRFSWIWIWIVWFWETQIVIGTRWPRNLIRLFIPVLFAILARRTSEWTALDGSTFNLQLSLRTLSCQCSTARDHQHHL